MKQPFTCFEIWFHLERSLDSNMTPTHEAVFSQRLWLETVDGNMSLVFILLEWWERRNKWFHRAYRDTTLDPLYTDWCWFSAIELIMIDSQTVIWGLSWGGNVRQRITVRAHKDLSTAVSERNRHYSRYSFTYQWVVVTQHKPSNQSNVSPKLLH